MYALTVLTLGVDDVDGLGLVADNTAITYLTTHLTIEWSIVEYQLIELVLLLSHLAVTHDVALIFSIVVAHELLLTLGKLYPVAVLNSSRVTGALLLLLHLYIELLLVNGEAVLTTDKLCKVERESVGVEQTECLNTIQLGLALSLQLTHSVVQHTDTLLKSTQE